jgi:valyl-tRNA synthetase
LEYYWPEWKTIKERTLGAYIRQVNLDCFWAREESTVKQNHREFVSRAEQAFVDLFGRSWIEVGLVVST